MIAKRRVIISLPCKNANSQAEQSTWSHRIHCILNFFTHTIMQEQHRLTNTLSNSRSHWCQVIEELSDLGRPRWLIAQLWLLPLIIYEWLARSTLIRVSSDRSHRHPKEHWSQRGQRPSSLSIKSSIELIIIEVLNRWKRSQMAPAIWVNYEMKFYTRYKNTLE